MGNIHVAHLNFLVLEAKLNTVADLSSFLYGHKNECYCGVKILSTANSALIFCDGSSTLCKNHILEHKACS